MRRNWFAGIEKCQLQAETLCLNFSTIWSSFCSPIQTLHSWTKINILKRSFITIYKGFADFSRVHLPCTLLVNFNCNLAHLNYFTVPYLLWSFTTSKSSLREGSKAFVLFTVCQFPFLHDCFVLNHDYLSFLSVSPRFFIFLQFCFTTFSVFVNTPILEKIWRITKFHKKVFS